MYQLIVVAGFCILANSRSTAAQNCSVADPLPTITDITCSTPEFSTACSLLDAAGLDTTLNRGGPFTIFLPNNDGFANLGQDLIDYLTEMANVAILEEIILNHAVDSETVVLSKRLTCGDSVLMLSGETTTTVCVERTGDIYQVGQGNLALDQDDELLPQILEPDILACNGVVHQISNVILSQSIADVVTNLNENGDDDDDNEVVDNPNPIESGCAPNIGKCIRVVFHSSYPQHVCLFTALFRLCGCGGQLILHATTPDCPFSVLPYKQPSSMPF
jgi:uncharacterized surface protein with fasciclin (FAS1) repeats